MSLPEFIAVVTMLAVSPAPEDRSPEPAPQPTASETSVQDLRTTPEGGHCFTFYLDKDGSRWCHVKWDDRVWVLIAGRAVPYIPGADGKEGLLLWGDDNGVKMEELDDPTLRLVARRITETVRVPEIVAIPLGRKPALPCNPDLDRPASKVSSE